MWDATVGELRAALERAGRRPLDDAHAMTLAVEAIDEAQEALAYFDKQGAHQEEIEDLERQVEDEKKSAKASADEAAEARENVERLRKALQVAEQDRDAARRDLAAVTDAGSASAFVAAAIRDRDAALSALSEHRARLSSSLRERAGCLRRIAHDLNVPRAQKGRAVAGLLSHADQMEDVAHWMGVRT